MTWSMRAVTQPPIAGQNTGRQSSEQWSELIIVGEMHGMVEIDRSPNTSRSCPVNGPIPLATWTDTVYEHPMQMLRSGGQVTPWVGA